MQRMNAMRELLSKLILFLMVIGCSSSGEGPSRPNQNELEHAVQQLYQVDSKKANILTVRRMNGYEVPGQSNLYRVVYQIDYECLEDHGVFKKGQKPTIFPNEPITFIKTEKGWVLEEAVNGMVPPHKCRTIP